ncbi:HAD family hydrolase [Devosia sp. XK-2]|uniref:HAD family hydrolase n=1 Tax=Devosia sp. XK-2 TaxID=3126689 RepID=UPI0030D55CEE
MQSIAQVTDTSPASSSAAQLALARDLAPVILFSDNEPFLPSRVGVSVLDAPGPSPSTGLDIAFESGVHRIIEYAIWWDWDVQHLYELEHIWLMLDAADRIVAVEASSHGGKFAMTGSDGGLPLVDGRITLISTPGKHAFTATVAGQDKAREQTELCCGELAGRGGVLINDMFRTAIGPVTAEDHRAVKRYLQARPFAPVFRFGQAVDLAELDVCTWPELASWIPGRVRDVLAQVRAEQPLLKAVLLDSGDTLVDEGSEVLDADGYVTGAELIPGALEMVEALAAEGYRLALVADGHVRSFETVLGGHGIYPHFEVKVISETERCQKPDRRMFEKALRGLGLEATDAGAVVMVGNHLERDIGGANRLGIVSIWQSWSHRRSRVPASADEVPRFTIRSPGELPGLLAEIERQMARNGHNPGLT